MVAVRQHLLLIFPTVLLVVNILVSGCETPLSKFEVQRPAQITVPKEVKIVYIKKDYIKDTHDRLGIKQKVLEQLVSELNRFKRFKVSIVKDIDESLVNKEKDTIGVIQGEIISGGEVDYGQFTEIANCKGGIAGRLLSAGAAVATNAVITLDSHAFVCKKGSLATSIVEGAATQVLSLLVQQAQPPVNEVVRIYNYKNVSLFAQANFSFI